MQGGEGGRLQRHLLTRFFPAGINTIFTPHQNTTTMGWWSTTIMGGDTPLDFKSEIFEVIDRDQFKDTGAKVRVPLEKSQSLFLNGKIDDIMNRWGCGKPDETFYKEYKSIGFQVLTVLMMGYGCKIQPELKALMREWILQDGWAKEDNERQGNIDDLIKKLDSYNGSAIAVKSESLLQKWQEKIG